MASFGLFYLGERVFHLDRDFIQSLMYLKLSVAGHLTIFITRTRGPFWSIRPARSAGGGDRHTTDSDPDSSLWTLYDTARLGLGIVGMGLCFGLVLLQ